MAKIDGTLVRSCSFTSTKPFGPIFTPTFSSPIPSEFGRKPTPTRILSHASSCAFPSTSTCTDERAALPLEPLRLRVHVDGAAALADPLLHEPHRLGIDAGEDLRQRLDEGHLRAELRVDGPELHPDDAAADADEPLRDLREVHRLLRAPDVLAVEGEARDLDRARAGRDDERRRLEPRRLAVAPFTSTAFGATNVAGPLHHLDAVPLLEQADAADQLLHDRVLELAELRDVHPRRSAEDAAVGRRRGCPRRGSPRR